MKHIAIILLMAAGTLSSLAGTLSPSKQRYAAGEDITIQYQGLDEGTKILIFKGLSLQPMLESLTATAPSGTMTVGNHYEPGEYTASAWMGDEQVAPAAKFTVADPDYKRGNFNMVVLSDIHVMAPELLVEEGKAFNDHVASDRKMLRQSAEIFTTMVDSIITLHPDLLVITGDLTKDGETASHQFVAAQLDRLAQAGVPSLVIPGNHDCNNPGAKFFEGDTWSYAPTVTREEFADIYSNYGYGNDVIRDPNSLSYVAEPVPGLVVLGIDSNEDEENTLVARGDSENHANVAGRIKAATLQWVLEQAQLAHQADKQVIALMHHHLVPHFDKEETLVYPYVLENATSVQRQFMEAGIRLVFTGHFHVQDVARTFNAARTDSITEVSSGALVGYPHPFRTVNFDNGFTQVQMHSGFIRSIASMHDLEAQSQQVLSNCIPSLVRTLVTMYWPKVIAKLEEKFGSLDLVATIMDIPETPADAAVLVNKYLQDPARRSYLLLTEGNEHLKYTKDLLDDINTGMDNIIYELVKPAFRTAVSGLLKVEVEERFGKVFTSVYQDLNQVDTPKQCQVNDLYLNFELPRATAVSDLRRDSEVKDIRYYDVAGRRLAQPQQGVNIVVTRYNNGQHEAIKTVN